MDKKSLKSLVCASFLAAVGLVSVADAVEPRVYQLGDGGAVAPHVRLEFGTDNNPLRSDDGSQESVYLRLQPSARYLVRQRNNRLELGYSGDFYNYFESYCAGNQTVRPGDCLNGAPSSNSASYQDHSLSLLGFLEISSRLRATLTASVDVENQPLGTGQSATRNILNSLTETESWTRRTVRAEVAYGADRARGRVIAGVTAGDRAFNSPRGDFDNLEERGVGPDVRLLYRIGTRTQLFAGLGISTVRGGDSERDISRQIAGIQLDTSAITSGRFSVSNVTEDFVGNASGRRDLQFFGWNAELTWRPRRFSTVTLSGGRESERGFFDDDIGLRTQIEAEWTHFWRDRFSTIVSVSVDLNEDLDEFSELTDAEDDAISFRLEGDYSIRRWLDIGAFFIIDSRNGRDFVDGTENSRDFGRTVVGITANGTI